MPETIEAEVIEIDGETPPPKPSEQQPEAGFGGQDMRRMVLKLDRRWWPLWAVLGVIAVVLIATVGVVLGALYLVFAVIRRVLRLLFGGFTDGTAQAGTLKRGL